MQGDDKEFIDIYDGEISYFIRCEHLARYIYTSEQFKKRRLKRIMDIACGSGYGTKELSKYADSVLAVDKQENCDFTDFDNIEFKSIDVDYVDLSDCLNIDKKLDGIACFETLEHVKYPKKLLMNLSSCLRKGGLLSLSLPNGQFEKVDENGINFNEYHLNSFLFDEIVGLLEECNFRIYRVLYQCTSSQLYRNEARAIRDLKLSKNEIQDRYKSYTDIYYDSRVFAWPDTREGTSYSMMFICERV